MRLLGFIPLLLLVTTCSSLAVEETVNAVQFKCGKVKFKCAMTFSFEASAARSQRLFHVHPKEQELHKRSLICHHKWLHGVRNVQEHWEEANFH